MQSAPTPTMTIQMIDHRFAVIGFGQSFCKNSIAHSEILRTARSSI